MPVIVAPEHEAAWLSADAPITDPVPCLTAYPPELMEMYATVPLVNDVNHEGVFELQEDTRTVMLLLGHKNEATTERYLGLAAGTSVAAVQRLSERL